ncbi:MAG: TIR domain-containing protein [Theionarchaea archaeon]|nr:TIR domain-containing protein [Theionarchaea archaeon]
MGSKAFRSMGPTRIDKLEDIARKEIRKKEPPKPRRRVFLSFRGEDLDLVNLFRGQAKNENLDIDFIDFSLRVPFRSDNAQYIKRGIRERIRNCSVTIVLIGKTTYRSEWVDWEVRESLKLGKGVIAVKLRDDSSIRTPPALVEHGIELLPWNLKIVNQAIQEAAERR